MCKRQYGASLTLTNSCLMTYGGQCTIANQRRHILQILVSQLIPHHHKKAMGHRTDQSVDNV